MNIRLTVAARVTVHAADIHKKHVFFQGEYARQGCERTNDVHVYVWCNVSYASQSGVNVDIWSS